MQSEPMLALSWKEPFGSLMLPPHEKIETRTRKTNYRGLVLICASKEPYSVAQVQRICGDEQFERIMMLGINWVPCLGHAIGVGRLVESRLMKPEDEDACFVQYHEPWLHENNTKNKVIPKPRLLSLHCWRFEEVRAIQPFKFKGMQGFQTVSAATQEKIVYL